MIIGIVGKARSGKDAFAEMLANEIFNETKQRYVLMAYAQELKLRVQRDFDLTYEQLWGDDKEVHDNRYIKKCGNCTTEPSDPAIIHKPFWTPREILQGYGEFYRSIDELFWVKHLFNTIEEKEYRNVIITDVRHPNEVSPVVEKGGYMIKVTSDRLDRSSIHGANHISEIAVDMCDEVDFVVKNDSTLKALAESTKMVAKFIIKAVRMKEKLED